MLLMSNYIILLIYINDILVREPNMKEIKRLKQQLSKKFNIKNLGSRKKILVMQIIRDKRKGTLKLSQEEYIRCFL